MGFRRKLNEQKLFLQALFLGGFCFCSSSAHSHRAGGLYRATMSQCNAFNMELQKSSRETQPTCLAALTFLACDGQVQPGSRSFSLCSEPGDRRAALIWWPQPAWVSSCVSKWFLDPSWFVLPLTGNANTVMVPSVPASVSHFSFTNTDVERPQCAPF